MNAARFNLVTRQLIVTAPITLSDEEGEALYKDLTKDITIKFKELKEELEKKHSDLIVVVSE